MNRLHVVILFLLLFACCFTSCRSWQDSRAVIAMADSIDQTHHVIYDDTAALGQTIRQLDNPFGRLFMRNTLGKAYYYMGRNYSLSNQIAEAADCYIEADRLQIDDPICRGRVNSNMAYICAQNNNDSLALIFYERSNKAYLESNNEWYFAQSLLNMSYHHILLHQFIKADSLLQIVQSHQKNSAYIARYLETRGLYHYEQQQYDSALVYLERGLNYWQSETDKCFSYLKIMQSYYFGNISMDSAVLYAHKLILISHNPNYISNAYYCLMQDAKEHNNTSLLSLYAHSREDANRLLNQTISVYAEATPKLEDYLQNPHPWRWVWITIIGFIVLSLFLFVSILLYRKHTILHLNRTTSRLQETTTLLHEANEKIENLSTRVEKQENMESLPKSFYYFNKNVNSIRSEFPAPSNKWNDYKRLKKDIDPWLHNWLRALDQLNLADREKILCIYTLLYPHLSTAKLAEYMNYDKDGIRVFKTRIVQKLGIKSSQLPSFLRKLSIKG